MNLFLNINCIRNRLLDDILSRNIIVRWIFMFCIMPIIILTSVFGITIIFAYIMELIF